MSDMHKHKIVGVDLGGTKIHSGLVVGDEVATEFRGATPQTNDKNRVIDAIKEAIDRVADQRLDGIGIGFPGVVDIGSGVVRNSNALSILNDVNLTGILEEEFNVPAYLNNDANCFALGEKHFGLGKGFEDIIGLTLGTGFGGGVVVHGKLYAGRNCGVGDFCSIKYKSHNLEYYCSSQFFINEYNTTAVDVHHSARKGSKEAIGIFNEYGRNLGEAIYTLVLAFDPEIIIIGGSIAKAKAYFEESIYEVLKTFPNGHIMEKLKIEYSKEANAAVLGAAALFYNAK
ncbi:MAG: ROK family protein [Bacteroidota bacterium]